MVRGGWHQCRGRLGTSNDLRPTGRGAGNVLSNAFSAECGLTAGSVVNIVTKSGGNSDHGVAVGVWRPSATQAGLSGFTTTSATSGYGISSNALGQVFRGVSEPI